MYERAVQTDPLLGSAQASLILIQASDGRLPRDEARDQLAGLARGNPRNRNLLSSVLNFYSRTEQYEAMLELVTDLITINPTGAILWRSKAIALAELGRDKDADEAYKRSLELVAAEDNAGELANTARPYVAFLLENHRYDEAHTVLTEALEAEPGEALLLLQLGELLSKQNSQEQARVAYTLALASSSNPSERSAVEDRLAKLDGLEGLRAAGLLNQEGKTSDESSSRVNFAGRPSPLLDGT